MGLFRKLFRGEQTPARPDTPQEYERPAWMHEGMDVQLYEGRADLEVVGESNYQDALWQAVGVQGSPR